jgi:hypothetical protein
LSLEQIAEEDLPVLRTRQQLPGGLLINGLEILRLCRVAYLRATSRE